MLFWTTVPEDCFESYKVSMRYQGSTLNSFNQSLVIGGSAGLYGSWDRIQHF